MISEFFGFSAGSDGSSIHKRIDVTVKTSNVIGKNDRCFIKSSSPFIGDG
jgi:hypothetical protein